MPRFLITSEMHFFDPVKKEMVIAKEGGRIEMHIVHRQGWDLLPESWNVDDMIEYYIKRENVIFDRIPKVRIIK